MKTQYQRRIPPSIQAFDNNSLFTHTEHDVTEVVNEIFHFFYPDMGCSNFDGLVK